METNGITYSIGPGDALLAIDVQNDFLAGGSLAVPGGNEILPVLNEYMRRFGSNGLPVFATRDWHPVGHCSFREQGGIWPPHCIAGTAGAEFAPALELPVQTVVISKATETARDAYSGFGGTDLMERLRESGIRRLFAGGLATDYCVLNTVKDALAQGFNVVLLLDAVRGVEVHPGDSQAAIDEMRRRGAQTARLDQLEK